MRKRRSRNTWWDSLLNSFFRPKTAIYSLVVIALAIVPSTVTDGMLGRETLPGLPFLPTKFNLRGIDISHHNGLIDWDAVKKDENNPAFCFLKATEGTDLIDDTFMGNWRSLESSGIKRGAYHFFNTNSDPQLQALNFILQVKLKTGDFVPVLDWENFGKKSAKEITRANAHKWLEVIEKHYGVKPMIYTNQYIYKHFMQDDFKEYPIWLSHYHTEKPEGLDYRRIYIWQYSMKGKMNGIASNVDLNVFLRDAGEIEQLILP